MFQRDLLLLYFKFYHQAYKPKLKVKSYCSPHCYHFLKVNYKYS